MRNLVKNNWFCFALAVVVFLVNQLVNIVDLYPVGYDEAWYGSTAYNFAHGRGFLNSIVGSRGNANFLFPVIAGTFMRIFGYNLLAIRLANVFCGVLALLFINLCFCQMKVSWQACALAFLFFVTIDLYNFSYRMGRPEGCAMMCLAGGVWTYLRYKESHSWFDIIGLSLFAYLAACAHPFSLLMFALMGIYIMIETIYTKEWIRLLQLFILLFAALAAIASITWVSNTYNLPGENYVQTRFSPQKMMLSIPRYFKSIFLNRKRVLYIIFLIGALFYLICSSKKYRDLAVISLVHLMIFPILFSSDLSMVIFGTNYVVLIATILLAPFWDTVGYNRKWGVWTYVFICMVNMCITYSYNYGKYYDNANTVLQRDFQQMIPPESKVFGPIRQWPLIMDTNYQSDHAYYQISAIDEFDFIITNSQDIPRYAPYKDILPINTEIMNLIYEKETKQYGLIQVYRNCEKK